ncbi:MAG: hypothetical protein QXY40_10635 [Candidatus Methanomethylicia archaeon]
MHIQYYIEMLFIIFALGAIVFMFLFSIKLARLRNGKREVVDEKKWFIVLVMVTVVFNVATLTLTPSQQWILWSPVKPDRVFYITMYDYKFYLPENPIIIRVGEPVEFIVTSKDVTYGFGIFRGDGTLVFQIQVIPWYNNSIVWIFNEPGKYTIRSTEYSGPKHPYMILPEAIEVKP